MTGWSYSQPPGHAAPDLRALAAWLRAALPDLPGAIEVVPLAGGLSNRTFRVDSGGASVVVRAPPLDHAAPGAHDVLREHDLLIRLHPIFPLAPRPITRCDDRTVIGTPFFVMEWRSGFVPRSRAALPPGFGPREARRLSEAFIDRLADLHALPLSELGLTGAGEPGDILASYVEGWARRYERVSTGAPAVMDWLADQLRTERPRGLRPVFVHSDFKLDNLVIDPGDPGRLTAILDWELAGLGDALADLGTALAYWVDADDDPAFRLLPVGPTDVPGALTRRQLAERYACRTGVEMGTLRYHYVLGLFKLCVLTLQLLQQNNKGPAVGRGAARLERHVRLLARRARHVFEGGDF